jgi:hypothetical protein
MAEEFIRLYGEKKASLLKELNYDEQMESVKSRKTDIIVALMQNFEPCADTISDLALKMLYCKSNICSVAQCLQKKPTNLHSACQNAF